jgi:hypothetical protein
MDVQGQILKSIRTVIASSHPTNVQPSAPPPCISSRFQTLFWVPCEHGQKLREHSGSRDQRLRPSISVENGQKNKAPSNGTLCPSRRDATSQASVGPSTGKISWFRTPYISLSQVYIMLSYHLHMARPGQTAPFRPAVPSVVLDRTLTPPTCPCYLASGDCIAASDSPVIAARPT